MMQDSSKDYGTGIITIHFDGSTPSQTEIDEYLMNNYGIGISGTVEIDPPNTYHGLQNPGSITVIP